MAVLSAARVPECTNERVAQSYAEPGALELARDTERGIGGRESGEGADALGGFHI